MENKSCIIIEEIILKDNIIDLNQIRTISFQYRARTFNLFKVVENILILISEFELFFIRLDELFSLSPIKISHYNFLPNLFKAKHIPLTFEWPVIDHNEKNELILLFYKSKILLIVNYRDFYHYL